MTPTVRVLGPVSVGSGAGEIGSARVRRLLAALLVRAGGVASADWLVDVVWGDQLPSRPAAALQTLVSRLRTAVEAAGGGVQVETVAPGYRLLVAPTDLDAAVFEALHQEAVRLLDDDPEAAATRLDEALQQWRGPAYAEFRDDGFARAEAERLEELRATAVEDRAEAGLRLGRHHEVAARLRQLVAEAPLRERRHRLLVLATHRAGRQAEALEVYRAYRERLDEELGLEPSPAMQDLHLAVLRDDPDLAWTPPPGAARTDRGSRPSRGNLPAGVQELVGRESELVELRALLEQEPVLTLTGPGGVGKTSVAVRLAQEVAPTYDAAHVVELAPVAEPDSLVPAVASSLDVPSAPDVAPLDRLLGWLSGQRLLLVLDNCEHLLDAAARLASEVARRCPDVRLVATSQAPLDAEGERVYQLRPLQLPDGAHAGADTSTASVRLFVARAAAHRRDFVVDDGNAAAVASVCRKLDGLPLAIELAAAKMRVMSPSDLDERLSGRFRLLHGGTRTAQARHRALHSLVDWSYRLLDAGQRDVFEVLAVFAGGFTLRDAESVVTEVLGGDEAAVADAVLGLVDRSMVVAEPGSPTTYRLLETLRAFGRERLAERPYAEAVQAAHARHHADLAVATLPDLFTARHVRSVEQLARVLDELRAAFRWALERDPRTAARIAGGTALLVESRMTAEAVGWADEVLEHPSVEQVPEEDLARVLLVATAGRRFSGQLAAGAQLAERAQQLRAEPVVAAHLVYLLSEAAYFEGDPARADRLLAEVSAFTEQHGLGSLARMCRMSAALAQAYRGEGPAASRAAAVLLHDAEARGERLVAGWCAYVRGEALLESDPDAAAPLLDEALERAEELRDRYLYGVTLVSVASVRSRHGDPSAARSLFRTAVDHWNRAGNWTHQWTTLRNVVVLLARLGRDEDAAILLGGVSSRDTSAQPHGPEAGRLDATRLHLGSRLGADRLEQLTERGARLGDGELVALARQTLAR